MTQGIHFEPAVADDNQGLKNLLRHSPMAGDIQLAYQREPNFFAACDIEGDSSQIMVAKHDGEVVGCFAYSRYQTFMNGQQERTAYLGQLRSLPAYRNKIRYIKQGFESCRKIHEASNAGLAYTSIVSDNAVAQRLLNAGIKGLPRYEQIATISTLAIPVTSEKFPSVIRLANKSDVPDLITFLNHQNSRFHMAPVWKESDFASGRLKGLKPNDFLLCYRGEQLVGSAAVWDQQKMKQYVIVDYAKHIKQWRLVSNLASFVGRGMYLPPIGNKIQYAFLSHLAIEEDNPEVLMDLIKAAKVYAKQKGIHLLLMGMDSKRPLCTEIKNAFLHLEYSSELYSVYWSKDLPTADFQPGRYFHPEIAIL